MALRHSRRLSGLEPEFAGICGVCKREIDMNLRNCELTICCSRPIHKECLRDLLNANRPCPYCEMMIFDALSGQLKQRALEELKKLMKPENIMAAITRVSRVVFKSFHSTEDTFFFQSVQISIRFSRQGTMRLHYFFFSSRSNDIIFFYSQ